MNLIFFFYNQPGFEPGGKNMLLDGERIDIPVRKQIKIDGLAMADMQCDCSAANQVVLIGIFL